MWGFDPGVGIRASHTRSSLLALGLAASVAFVVGCGSAAQSNTPEHGGVASAGADGETAEPIEREPLPTTFGPVELVSVKNHAELGELNEVDYWLHSDLAGELELLALPSAAERYELSAAVTELHVERRGNGLIANCVVTATVTHPTRGIVATMRGKARAEDEADEGQRAERSALAEAARSSVRGIAAALDTP